ncbi:VWFA and cache domain-containing protein 1 [Stylophora pistillata]|uniref:VWFA and cache domain-containing protein 1 n=1 Tax=Stylophora pistillata TaxID=50429 RepID=A0A2B4RA35_STYPI|nr:VWFA and cache domain-containing protein 1 [Stylophora pistillata]
MHPLLPAPSDAFDDPIFMDITAFKPEPEFTSVFLSIKSTDLAPSTLAYFAPFHTDFEFLYHRLDLMKPDSPCVHFSSYTAKDLVVVKFSSEALTDPYGYLCLDESLSKVNAYKRFMTSTRAANPGFKGGIRDTVIATKKVEDIWFREKKEYTKYLVWRLMLAQPMVCLE